MKNTGVPPIIKPIRVAQLQALFFGLIGFVFGVLYSFGGLLIDILVSLNWYHSTETPGLSIGTILAFGALLGMPLLAALLGFVLGIIEGWVLVLLLKLAPHHWLSQYLKNLF